MKYNADDLTAMAQTAWGEARGDGLMGMLGVLWVIHNRTKDSRWPDSVELVCKQEHQFTAWNPGNPNREKMLNVTRNHPLYEAALGMAKSILEECDTYDPTSGANHYYAGYIKRPDWAKDMTFVARIGEHFFFRG